MVRNGQVIRFGLLTSAALALAMSQAPVLAQGSSMPAKESAGSIVQDQTSGTVDPLYQQPYIDVDEWRDGPVRHRYIHGGFRDTEARFSFYFPDRAGYEGRFYQYITPFPLSELLTQEEGPGEYNKIGFALASGGYFIETNGGGAFDLGRGQMGGSDPTVAAYRANAAAAQYSRVVAKRIFASEARPYGYAFGGSGGAYRTIGSIENTTGVWDGVVPYVAGSPMAIPSVFTARMLALQVLHDKLPQIVDAMEPGGSGDPYAGLNEEEAATLREVTRMGFPPASWFGYKTMGIHGFIALYGGVLAADPGYFQDFWTKPGYLGSDPPAWLRRDRIQFTTTIAAPLGEEEAVRLGMKASQQAGGVDSAFQAGAPPAGFKLSDVPPQVYFQGGDLIVKTGAAAGERVMLVGLKDDLVVTGVANPDVLAKIKPGDQVEVDNSNFLASFTYHRHQVPGPEYHVWDQFRDASGQPIYPQRPMLLGPMFTQATAGSLPSGKFEGKMIMVESLLDREAFPWQADWYRQEVRRHHDGRDDDRYRVWMTDHALHGDEQGLEDPSRTVEYTGILQQALRDVAAWAERGVVPPASTAYRVEDGQVIVPGTASERLGIQPVAQLAADGDIRADVTAGSTVTLVATIDVPPGTGQIISATWDPEGAGTFPAAAELPQQGGGPLTLTYTYRYDRPGTFFPGIRIRSQRDGNVDSPYAQPANIGRARVVVR